MPEDVSRQLERRDFLKLLGPGLYIVASSDALIYGQQLSYPEDFNSYLRIAEDGGVRVTLSPAERLRVADEVVYDPVLAGLK